MLASIPAPRTHVTGRRPRLLTGCAIAVALVAVAQAPRARAQINPDKSFQGTGTATRGNASIVQTGTQDTITLNTVQTVIDWRVENESGTGPINFLPEGRTGLFQAGEVSNFVVLNRIVPTDASRGIRLDGTVRSQIRAASGAPTTGGSVWFYSPGGIIAGASSVFDVGSLLLTTNNIDVSDGLFGRGGEIRFRGAEGSQSAVQIDAGAQIRALATGSYVALVAPRIVQNGNVQVDGSAAYIAAEQADVTINNGLFDIRFIAGAEGGTAITHGGTTTGPASTGAGDPHRIYMAAVAKNDAVSMLLNGTIGYAPAASATVENGVVVLTAGYDVAAGAVGARAGGPGGEQIDIGTSTFTSTLTANATDSILVNPGGANGSGTVRFNEDATLTAINSVIAATESASEGISASGNLTLRATGTGTGAQRAALSVLGAETGYGGVFVGGALTVDASGNGGIFSDIPPVTGASGVGGTASVDVTGSFVNAGTLVVRADGAGGAGSVTGGAGRAGSASVTLTNSDLQVIGSALISATGIGGFGGTTGGAGTGGSASLVLRGDSFVDINRRLGSDVPGLTLNASGVGFGSVQQEPVTGGAATGGSASIDMAGGQLNLFGPATLNGSATGGRGTTISGAAQGGSASFTQTAGTAAITDLTINAAATSEGSFISERSRAGTTTGGTASLAVSGGSLTIADDVALVTSASAFGIEGADATGGDVTLTVGPGGTVSVGDTLQIFSFAQTSSFAGIGGNATAGDISLSLNGGSLEAASLLGYAYASAGSGDASGGVGTGGTIGIRALTGGALGITDSTDLDATGSGGGGTNADPGGLPTARPGAGNGGTVIIAADNGTIALGGLANIDVSGVADVSFGEGVTGPTGTGGLVDIDVAGADGALSFGSLFIDADGGSAFSGEGGLSNGDGGAGNGGRITIDLLGGSITGESLSAGANGFGGGAFGDFTGGTGTGGTITANLNGSVDVGSIGLFAAGVGGEGDSGGDGGIGRGGTTSLNILGGSFDAGSLSLGSDGRGGDGGSDFADDGGVGGDGLGGTTSFIVTTGATANIGDLLLTASGQGGAGGDVFFFDSGYGDYDFADVNGAGGAGTGGIITANIAGTVGGADLISIGGLTVYTVATGGEAGRFIESGYGTDSPPIFGPFALGGPGAGGDAFGGSASLTIAYDGVDIGGITVDAGATAGDGALGRTGGAGGSAFGGVALFDTIHADFAIASLTVTANAIAGNGANSLGFGGNGGDGGYASGGTATVRAQTADTTLTIGQLTLTSNATAGTAGAGSDGEIGGNGGAGGVAAGGTAQISAIDGSILFDNTVFGGDPITLYTISANATGGAGGAGGAGSNFGDTGGFGGIGGSGTGGTVRIGATGGSISGPRFTLNADGTGAVGGVGGTGASFPGVPGDPEQPPIPGVTKPVAANGDGIGGTAALFVSDGAAFGRVDLGAVTMNANGFGPGGIVGGLISLRDESLNPEGSLILDSLNAQANGFGGGGFDLYSTTGRILVEGDATIDVGGTIRVDAVGSGGLRVNGLLSAVTDADALITHSGQPATGAPFATISAEDIGVETYFGFVSTAGSRLVADSTIGIVNRYGDSAVADVEAFNSIDIATGGNLTIGNALATAPAFSRGPDAFGGTIRLAAGVEPFGVPGESGLPYQAFDLTVTGTVRAPASTNLFAGGDVIVAAGGAVRSDNRVTLRSGDDIIVRAGGLVRAAEVPLETGYGGEDPLATPARLELFAGSLFVNQPIPPANIASVIVDGQIAAPGRAITISGDALQVRGNPIDSRDLFVSVSAPPAPGAPISNDGGALLTNCSQGSICLSDILADGVVAIGQGDRPISVSINGGIDARLVAIRSRDTLTLGVTGGTTSIAASERLFLDSLGDVELLTGTSVSSGGSFQLIAGGSLLGSGQLSGTGDMGITVGDGLSAASIVTGGQLTTAELVGGEPELGYALDGDFRVGSVTIGTGGLFVDAGGAIDIGAVTVTPEQNVGLIAGTTAYLGGTTGVGELSVEGESVGFGTLTSAFSMTLTGRTGSVVGTSADSGNYLTIAGNGVEITTARGFRDVLISAGTGNAIVGSASAGEYVFISADGLADVGSAFGNLAVGITGGSVDVGFAGSSSTSGGSVGLTATSGSVNFGSVDGVSITITAPGAITGTDIYGLSDAFVSGSSITLDSVSGGSATLRSGSSRVGTITLDDRLEMSGGAIDLGTVTAGGSVSLAAGTDVISFGTIDAGGSFSATGGTLTGGTIDSVGDAFLSLLGDVSVDRITTSGETGYGSITILADGSVRAARLDAARNLRVSAASLTGRPPVAGRGEGGSVLVADLDIDITTLGDALIASATAGDEIDFDIGGGLEFGALVATRSIESSSGGATAGDMARAGTSTVFMAGDAGLTLDSLTAGTSAILNSMGTVTLGTATAGGDLGIGAGRAILGTITTTGATSGLDGNVVIVAAGPLSVTSVDAFGSIGIQSFSGLSAGPLEARGDIAMALGGDVSLTSVTAGGAVAMQGVADISFISIAAGGAIGIDVENLIGGSVTSGAVLTINAAEALELSALSAQDIATVFGGTNVTIDAITTPAGGSFTAGGDLTVGGLNSGGLLSLEGFNVSVLSDITDADQLAITTLNNLTLQNVTLAGDFDVTVPGALSAGIVTSGTGSIIVDAGTIDLAGATAWLSVDLTAAGDVSVGSGSAGDDFLVDAVGSVTLGDIVATGVRSSAGDGFGDLRIVTGSGVTASSLMASDRLSVTAGSIDADFVQAAFVDLSASTTANIGTIFSSVDLQIETGDLLSAQEIYGANVDLSGGRVEIGNLVQAENLSITSASDVIGGSLFGFSGVTIEAGGVVDAFEVLSDISVDINASSARLGAVAAFFGGTVTVNTIGDIEFGVVQAQDASLTGFNIIGGDAEVLGTLSVAAEGSVNFGDFRTTSLTIDTEGTVTGNRAQGADITITGGSIDLGFVDGQDALLTAQTITVGEMALGGSAVLRGGDITVTSAIADSGIDIDATDTVDAMLLGSRGLISVTAADRIDIGAIDTLGLIDVSGGADVEIGSINAQGGGRVDAFGDLTVGGLTSAGLLTLDGFNVTVLSDITDANDLAITTLNNLTLQDVTLTGNFDVTVPGALAAGTITSGGDIIVDAGTIDLAGAVARFSVDLTAAGAIAVGTGSAGDDFLVNAGGSASLGSIVTTGAETGYGGEGGDGLSNIAIAATGGVTAGTLDAFDNLLVTSTGGGLAGPPGGATLIAGGNINVMVGGSALVTSADAGNNLMITASGLEFGILAADGQATLAVATSARGSSLTTGGSAIVNAGGGVTIDSLASGDDASVNAGLAGIDIGSLTAADTVSLSSLGGIALDTGRSGGRFGINAEGDVIFGSITTTGSEFGYGSTIDAAVGGALTGTTLDSAGQIIVDADGGIDVGTLRSAGFASVIGGAAVTIDAISTPVGGSFAAAGDLTVGGLDSGGLLSLNGFNVTVLSDITDANALAITTRNNLTLQNVTLAGTFGVTVPGALTAGTVTSGGDIIVNAGAIDLAGAFARYSVDLTATGAVNVDTGRAGDDFLVDAGGAVSLGSIVTTGAESGYGGEGGPEGSNIIVASGGAVVAGRLQAFDGISITADAGLIGLPLPTSRGEGGSVLVSGGDIDVTTGGDALIASANAGDDIDFDIGGGLEFGTLVAAGSISSASGGATAGDMARSGSNAVFMAGAAGLTLDSLTVGGSSILSSTGTVTLGTATVGGDLGVSAGDAVLGSLTTTGTARGLASNIVVIATDTVSVDSIDAFGGIGIQAGGDVDAGTLEAGTNIALVLGGDAVVDSATAGSAFAAQGTGSLAFGAIAATGLVDVDLGILTGGSITSGAALNIDTTGLIDIASLTAQGAATVNGGSDMTIDAISTPVGGSFTAAGDLIVGALNSGGLLSLDGFNVTVLSDITDAQDLAITTANDLTLQNVTLSGDFGVTVPGTITALTITSGGDIIIDAGAIDLAGAFARFSVDLTATDTIAVGTGSAGDDFLVDAGGDVSLGSIVTTGAESGYGGEGGDGLSNIVVSAGSGVTAGTLNAFDNLLVTAAEGGLAGPPGGATLIAGGDITVMVAGSALVASADAGDDLMITADRLEFGTLAADDQAILNSATGTSGRTLTSGGSAIVNAGGGVTIETLTAGDDASVSAGLAGIDIGMLTAGDTASLTSLGGIALDAGRSAGRFGIDAEGDVIFGSITTTGSEFGYGTTIDAAVGGALTGTTLDSAGQIIVDAGGGIDLGTVRSAGFASVTGGADVTIDAISTPVGGSFVAVGDLTVGGLNSGGLLSLDGFNVTVLSDITDADNLAITTDNNLTLQNVTLSGDFGVTVPGTITALTITSGGDIIIDAGAIDLAGAFARFGVDLTATGTIAVGTGRAGEDFLVDAGGDVSLGSIVTTGAESGYGGEGGDGTSNIFVTSGGNVSAGTLDAFDNVAATAEGGLTGQPLPTGRGEGGAVLISGGGIAVTTGGDALIASADAGSEIVINTGGSLEFGTLDAGFFISSSSGGGVSGDGATAGGDIRIAAGADGLDVTSLAADGTIDLLSLGGLLVGTGDAGGDFLVDAGGDVSLGTISATGESGYGGEGGGGNIVIAAGGLVGVGSATATGAIDIDADGDITGTSFTAGDSLTVSGRGSFTAGTAIVTGATGTGDATIDAATGIDILTLRAAGDAAFTAASGDIAVTDDIAVNGIVTALGRSVLLNALGSLRVSSATATAGAIDIDAGLALNVDAASATSGIALTSSGGSVTAGTLTTIAGDGAGDIMISAGDDVVLGGAVTARGALTVEAGDRIGIAALADGTSVTLSSNDIDIGAQARVGTIGKTTLVDITNSGGRRTFVGGAGGNAGFDLSAAELARIFSNDIFIHAPPVESQGETSVGSSRAPDVIVGSFTLTSRAGTQGGNLGADGTFGIDTSGKLRVVGDALFTGLGAGNRVELIADDALEVNSRTGSILLNGGGGLAGTLVLTSDDIFVGTLEALADIAAAPDMATIDDRLGLNDGVLDEGGAIQAGGLEVVAGNGFFVQNSGVESPVLDDRRGFTVGTGGLTIRTGGAATRIVINGREVDPATNGFFTGIDLIPRVRILGTDGDAPGAFDQESTINGCLIVNSAACQVTVTFPVQDVIQQITDPSRVAVQPLESPLIELRDFERFGFQPLIDEPVTGAGNDDFWTDECRADPRRPDCPIGN